MLVKGRVFFTLLSKGPLDVNAGNGNKVLVSKVGLFLINMVSDKRAGSIFRLK